MEFERNAISFPIRYEFGNRESLAVCAVMCKKATRICRVNRCTISTYLHVHCTFYIHPYIYTFIHINIAHKCTTTYIYISTSISTYVHVFQRFENFASHEAIQFIGSLRNPYISYPTYMCNCILHLHLDL